MTDAQYAEVLADMLMTRSWPAGGSLQMYALERAIELLVREAAETERENEEVASKLAEWNQR